MTVLLDPDKLEIQALTNLADFNGKRILEIGCGDGRLTWEIAPSAHRVIAIDPKPERIEQARQVQSKSSLEKLSFLAVGLEDFAHGWVNQEKFDLAILSWSL